MLISFDGIDGCGKSTQIEKIANILRSNGFKVLTTKDPGDNKISEQIRSILLNPENSQLCNISELYLFLAARRQNYEQVILPVLKDNYIVLTDRWIASSYAYQGFGKSLFFLDSDDEIETSIIEKSGKIPNISIILDLPIEIAFERIKNKVKDRIETNNLEFYKKVRQGFIAYCEFYKNSIIVNSNQSVENVTIEIIENLKQFEMFENLKIN